MELSSAKCLPLIFTFILAAVVYSSNGQPSPQPGGCAVGHTDAVLTLANANEKSSLLQIFDWMRAPCSGLVQSVTYINHSPGIKKSFYLAAFSPTPDRTGWFSLFNYAYIEIDSTAVGWQTAQVQPTNAWRAPFQVEAGTVFGIFYDFWDIGDFETVVPYRSNNESDPNATRFPTYLGFLSISDVRQLRVYRRDIELSRLPLSRIPALLVKVTPGDVGKTCGLRVPLPNYARLVTGSALDKNLPGDFLVYECNSGRTVLKNMFVTCQADGNWTSLPVCSGPIDCTVAPSIPNGQVVYIRGTIKINCNPGFILTGGRTTAICDVIRQSWPELPSCTRTCGAPPAGPYLVVDYQSFEDGKSIPGSIVRYRCQRGYSPYYYPLGEVICGADGKWPSLIPRCIPGDNPNVQPGDVDAPVPKPSDEVDTCLEEPIVRNATAIFRSYNVNIPARAGDYVVFRCDNGFELDKTSGGRIQCDGINWSRTPQCFYVPTSTSTTPTASSTTSTTTTTGTTTVNYCPPAPVVSNAVAAITSWKTGDSPISGDYVHFQCNDGFVLDDFSSATVICQTDRLWSRTPKCIPASVQPAQDFCAKPPFVPFATLEAQQYKIVATCLRGYTLNGGSDTATCDPVAQKWSTLPVCIKLCGPAPSKPHLQIVNQTFEGGNSLPGSKVVYKCTFNGYRMDPPSGEITCSESGRWPIELPSCIVIPTTTTPAPTCPNEPTIEKGFIKSRTYRNGTRARKGDTLAFECLPGYSFIDGSLGIVKCEIPNWSTLPSCIESQYCDDEPRVGGAEIVDRTQPVGTRAKVGDKLTYRCVTEIGFVAASGYPNTINCTKQGWSPDRPVCYPTCGLIPSFDRAKPVSISISGKNSVSGDFSVNGDSVTFKCSDGYTANGTNFVSICVINETSKTWSPISACIRSCGFPPFIANGNYEAPFISNQSMAGQTIRYRCIVGYDFATDTSAQLTCQPTGEWTGDLPRCVPLQGPAPTSTSTSTSTSKTTTTTTPAGAKCDRVPDVTNARVVSDGGFSDPNRRSRLGVVITYECLQKTILETDFKEILCLPNGWSSSPKCSTYEEVAKNSPCGAAPVVPNAFLSSVTLPATLQYSCLPGFDLAPGTANMAVRCLSVVSRWSQPFPKCVPSVCGNAPEVVNADASSTFEGALAQADDVATYKCRSGYIFANQAVTSTKCLPDGRWTVLPVCVEVTATTRTSTTTTKATTTTTRPKPPENVIDEPTRCGQLPRIEYGRVVRWSNASSTMRAGDWAEFDCNDGYTPGGFVRIICQSNAQWSEPPNCLPLATPGCEGLPGIPNGYVIERMTGNSSTFQANRVRIACDYGYTLNGDDEVLCINQKWLTLPTCIKDLTVKSCGKTPTIANGVVVYKDFDGDSSTLGSKVTYRCLDGYVLSSGSKATAICLSGSWSNPPQCISSPPAVDLPNLTSPAPVTGSSVIYCSRTLQVRNGVIASSTIALKDEGRPPSGSVVIYECLEGFVLNTRSRGIFGSTIVSNYVQCGMDGTWTELPECIPDASCKTPAAIENGRISERTYTGPAASAGDKVWFTCLPGYELQPRNAFSQCNKGGSWSQFPECVPVVKKCEPQPSVPNGRIVYQSSNGSVYVFGCGVGFILDGIATVTCLASGKWSALPTCKSRAGRCSKAPTILNSIIEARSFPDNAVPAPGDFFRIRCAQGYVMDRTNNQIVCLSNGDWSDIPNCRNQIDSCGPVSPVQNAKITFSTVKGDASVVGDIAWYDCGPEFEASCSQAIRCLPTRQWTPGPVCRLRNGDSCGNPPALQNGYIIGDFGPTVNTIGTQIAYDCLPYYTLFGPRVITCQRGGTWTRLPTCVLPQKQTTCGPFQATSNVVETDRNFFDESSTIDSYVTVTCSAPFVLQGPSRITCLETGDWSEQPRCVTRASIDQSCGAVPRIENGEIVSSSLPANTQRSIAGDSLWYTCVDGYQLKGYPGATCNDNGAWSPLPSCESQTQTCPNSVSLIFVVDMPESATSSFNNQQQHDAANVNAFIKSVAPLWQRVTGGPNKQVDLSVAAVTLRRSIDRSESWITVKNLQSDSSLSWNNWLDANILPFRGVLVDDISRLLQTVRLRVLPGLPAQSAPRIVLLTSANRGSTSINSAVGEIAALRSASARLFVYGVGGAVAEPSLQFAWQTVASDVAYFRFVQASDQLRSSPERLLRDSHFLNFLCQSDTPPVPISAKK